MAEQSSGPILVTGSAGFIGSHVVEALLGRGDDVVGVDNFDPFYEQAIKRRNLAAIDAHARADAHTFVEADIRDADAMRAVFETHRPAGVIHLAAKAGVRPSIVDPEGYVRTNVLGTMIVLESAKQVGCSRVALASSSSVYGNNEHVPFSEADDVSHPISPYAATKVSCEMIASSHFHLTGMPTACLRFFTVYGPRQRPDLAINLFMRRIAAGEPIRVFGDGTSSRDYTFIDDIVTGVLATYNRIPDFGYRVWNLGSDSPITLAEMVRSVAGVVGREPRIERQPMQPGDVSRTWADLTRSGEELGYRPGTPFAEGLERQWAWLGKAYKSTNAS